MGGGGGAERRGGTTAVPTHTPFRASAEDTEGEQGMGSPFFCLFLSVTCLFPLSTLSLDRTLFPL